MRFRTPSSDTSSKSTGRRARLGERLAVVTGASAALLTHKAQGQAEGGRGKGTEVLQAPGRSAAVLVSALLSWRRVCSVLTNPHLPPEGVGLSVQDGTQASKGSVGPRLDSVGRGQPGLRLGRLHGADVVGGPVPSSPPEVSQVGEAQFLWLVKRREDPENSLPPEKWTMKAY